MSRAAVVFDLDGTLADTAPDLIAAGNRVMAEVGLPSMPLEVARTTAGFGAKALIKKGYELAGHPLPVDQLDAMWEAFIAHYRANLAEHSVLYDGVIDTLDALDAEGYALGVCTNKPEALAVSLLDQLGILDRFGALIGADTLPVRKPHPTPLLETVERIGGDPERTIMIGDTETDLKTARACDMPVLLCDFGYSPTAVHLFKPDAVFSSYDGFSALVDTHIRRPAQIF